MNELCRVLQIFILVKLIDRFERKIDLLYDPIFDLTKGQSVN